MRPDAAVDVAVPPIAPGSNDLNLRCVTAMREVVNGGSTARILTGGRQAADALWFD